MRELFEKTPRYKNVFFDRNVIYNITWNCRFLEKKLEPEEKAQKERNRVQFFSKESDMWF